jgi:hypothetical protein
MQERGISEAEYEQVLRECPKVLANQDSLLAQIKENLKVQNDVNLSNAVYGSYSLIYACRYQTKVLKVFAGLGGQHSLMAFAYNPKLEKFEIAARKLHIKALSDFRKFLEKNYEYKVALAKEHEILRLAHEREGSGKFDLDLGPV